VRERCGRGGPVSGGGAASRSISARVASRPVKTPKLTWTATVALVAGSSFAANAICCEGTWAIPNHCPSAPGENPGLGPLDDQAGAAAAGDEADRPAQDDEQPVLEA